MDAIFKTDFRIWTFAFKTFEASAIPAAVKYMPFFFVYYFVSGAAAISNTSSEKLQGGWGYLLAALTNMGGILLWLVLQYGTLFRTGVAFYPGQALGGILLFALVPSLAIASCLAKYLYKKTGSVYVAAFPEYHPDDHDDRGQHRDLFPGISTTADWGCTLQCGPFVR